MELIRRLVKQGVISEEQLHEAMIETPDKQVKGAAETLHSLLCYKYHVNPQTITSGTSTDIDSEACSFYLEDTLDDSWSYPDHKLWTLEAVNLMSRLKLALPSDLSKFLDSLIVTVKLVDNLLSKYPEGKEVLRKATGI